MKVTIACDVLGQPNNGTTIATLNLIHYLRAQGHTVTVICCDEDKKGIDGYCVVPKLRLGPLANHIISKNGVSPAKPDKKLIKAAIAGADVVQVQFGLVLGRTAVKIARKMHKPITASFHCQAENVTAHLFMAKSRFANWLTYQVLYHNVYKYCDCVHYPTAFIRDIFEHATHPTNGYVISNGVNEQYVNRHIPHQNAKFTIVSTGRFSREKAQQILIKAAAHSQYRDSIKLVFAGEGPYREVYEKIAETLHVDASFKFYTREELITVLNTADLYVHTAFAEIEAIGCTEAICCGLVPVIANAADSATKAFALDDNNLFPENDYRALAQKIDFWYEHPVLKAQYAERYIPLTKQFSQQECMKQMEKMLQTAIDKHRR